MMLFFFQPNPIGARTTTAPKTVQTYDGGILSKTESFTGDASAALVERLTYGYDTLKRPVTTTHFRTGPTTTAYISATCDVVASVTEENGEDDRTTSFTYDTRGNRLTTKHPDNSESRARYDTYGRLTATWASLTYASVRSYDYAGRLLTLRTSPDSDDNDPTDPSDDFPIDSGGTVTFWQYSPATGLLTGKFHDYEGPDNDDGPTYDHTPAGRLETRTSKRNILTTYHYDPAGDLRAIDYPGTSGTPDILYTRDRLGRVTTAAQGTLNAGATALATTDRSTTYGYDTVKFTLDTETTNLGGGFPTKALTRHYDAYARPRSLAIGTEYTTAYAYDTAGRLHQVWHQPVLDDPQQPAGGITFTYGYLSDTTAGHGSLLHTVTKAAVGNDPALVATRTWESTRDVLKKIENTAGQTVRSSYDYSQVNGGVNSIGQRMGVQTTFNLGVSPPPPNSPQPGNTSYGYDSLGQLTSADHNTVDSLDRAYQYDDIGNRVFSEISNTQISDPPVAGTTSYFGNTGATQPGANALNQYAAVKVGTANPLLPQHDVDGNLVEDAAHNHSDEDREYVWDAENRLIAVNEVTARSNGAITGTTRLVTYGYDHLSRLITRTTDGDGIICYLDDGWNRIAEYNFTPANPEANPPTEAVIDLSRIYTWGLDLSGTMQGAGGVGGLLAVRQGGVSYYPAFDGNGNISDYLGGNGIAVAHFEYDPFGNLVVDSFNNAADFPYRFSTKPQDMLSGWYYYGYRWYDPLTGRWPSRDPIGEEGGVNMYGFVENCGPNRVDILGEWALAPSHKELTENAWNELGLTEKYTACPEMLKRIVAGNLATDSPPLDSEENLRYHFNRKPTQSRESAINEYADELDRQVHMYRIALDWASNATVRGEWDKASISCKAALHIFGTLTHMWQDYYGHAVQNSARNASSKVGVLNGSPLSPDPDFKPSSWAGIIGSYYGVGLDGGHDEHGFTPRDHEPGTRDGQKAARQREATNYTKVGMEVFLKHYYQACRCSCLYDRISALE